MITTISRGKKIYTLSPDGFCGGGYSELTVDHVDNSVPFPYVIALDGIVALNKRGIKDLIAILTECL